MAHYKHYAKKRRLYKLAKQNRLPPIWVGLKKYGIRGIKALHLLRKLNERVQRHWRRNDTGE